MCEVLCTFLSINRHDCILVYCIKVHSNHVFPSVAKPSFPQNSERARIWPVAKEKEMVCAGTQYSILPEWVLHKKPPALPNFRQSSYRSVYHNKWFHQLPRVTCWLLWHYELPSCAFGSFGEENKNHFPHHVIMKWLIWCKDFHCLMTRRNKFPFLIHCN